MTEFDFLETELNELAGTDLLRSPVRVDSAADCVIRIGDSEKVLFCSNNYLNLANDKRICVAAKAAIDKFGFGSAASRLISGSAGPHVELEKVIAEFFNKESALVFATGFMANLGILQAIPKKGDLVLLDKLDHASIIDAAKSSRAEFRTFHRNQFSRIEKFLASDKYNHKFIITESVFSMDGDFAELAKLVELKKKYNAFLIVDEAHAFGCLGDTGAGLAEQLGLLADVDIVVATLSKAAGCMGGILAADKVVTDFLVNKARPFIYTTAPVVCNSAAAAKAVEIIKAAADRREKLKANADYLRVKLTAMGLDTGSSRSHIIPVIIGDSGRTVKISRQLFEKGFFVVAIRPPTVGPGQARLRISVQCGHSRNQIDSLCAALADIIADLI